MPWTGQDWGRIKVGVGEKSHLKKQTWQGGCGGRQGELQGQSSGSSFLGLLSSVDPWSPALCTVSPRHAGALRVSDRPQASRLPLSSSQHVSARLTLSCGCYHVSPYHSNRADVRAVAKGSLAY